MDFIVQNLNTPVDNQARLSFPGRPLASIEYGYPGVTSEILNVEGQDTFGSVNHHRGYLANVVAVFSADALRGDEPLPFVRQRGRVSRMAVYSGVHFADP